MSPDTDGWEFITAIGAFEDHCAKTSSAFVQDQGFASAKLSQLGKVLQLLYRFSCCYWGCHGREHAIEYIAGRSVTSSLSALRSMFAGYYDESLTLTRNVAEAGNLLNLFMVEPGCIRLWLDLPDVERQRKFRPVKVREALETKWGIVPIDAGQYGFLSSRGVHLGPETRPGAHNLQGRPILGCVLQPEGVLTVLDHLAWAVCTVAGPAAKLSPLDGWPAEYMVDEVVKLVEMRPDLESGSTPTSS